MSIPEPTCKSQRDNCDINSQFIDRSYKACQYTCIAYKEINLNQFFWQVINCDLFLLKFVHSCVLGQPIDAFKNYFKIVEHDHNTRSQSHGQLERPNIWTELGRSTAHFSGATLWNSIPSELKLIQTEENFKKAIQIYLKDNQNTV